MAIKTDQFNYLFVSDFHVAAGTNDLGEPSPREDFFFDEEFRRFLEWADSHRVNNRKWELVFVGDCFDFLPIQLQSIKKEIEKGWGLPGSWIPTVDGNDLSEEEFLELVKTEEKQEKEKVWLRQAVSISRLALISDGHPAFFKALGWWVGRGNRLVVMRGNHDMELYWPGVQQALKILVWLGYSTDKQKAGSTGGGGIFPFPDKRFEERIVFEHSLFYYKPGLFYAEHGFQHEIFCAAVNPLRPSIKQKDGAGILIPDFGGILVNYFVAPMEDVNPSWENSSNPAKFVIEYLRDKPEEILRYLVSFRSLWQGWKMSARIWKLVNEYKGDLNISEKGLNLPEADLKAYADELGVPPTLLDRLLKIPRQPLISLSRLSWFMFSAWGHVLKALLVLLGLAIGLWAIYWYFFTFSPVLSGWVAELLVSMDPSKYSPLQRMFGEGQSTLHALFQRVSQDDVAVATTLVVWVGSIIAAWSLKDKILKIISALIVLPLRIWIWPDAKRKAFAAVLGKGYDPEEHLFPAAQMTEKAFRKEFKVERGAFDEDIEPEPRKAPRFYIFGHDHHPAARKIPDSDAVYFNTGSWLPSFVREDARRQRTGGMDIEFTFLEISKHRNEDYMAVLKRWNDSVGAPSIQIVDPIKPESRKKG